MVELFRFPRARLPTCIGERLIVNVLARNSEGEQS